MSGIRLTGFSAARLLPAIYVFLGNEADGPNAIAEFYRG